MSNLRNGWRWTGYCRCSEKIGIAKKRYRDFVESAESSDKESNSKEIPQLKSLKPRPTPEELTQVVSDEFGCGREIILQKGKKRNLVRGVAIYFCREMTGETGVALGRRFDISGAEIAIRHNQTPISLKRIARLRCGLIESESK